MRTSSMVFWYDGAAGLVCCHAGQRSSPLASSPRTLVTQAHSELKLTQNSDLRRMPRLKRRCHGIVVFWFCGFVNFYVYPNSHRKKFYAYFINGILVRWCGGHGMLPRWSEVQPTRELTKNFSHSSHSKFKLTQNSDLRRMPRLKRRCHGIVVFWFLWFCGVVNFYVYPNSHRKKFYAYFINGILVRWCCGHGMLPRWSGVLPTRELPKNFSHSSHSKLKLTQNSDLRRMPRLRRRCHGIVVFWCFGFVVLWGCEFLRISKFT